MKMFHLTKACFVGVGILSCLFQYTVARSTLDAEKSQTFSQTENDGWLPNEIPIYMVVGALGSLVIGVFLLVGCADWCQRQDGFKETTEISFENQNYDYNETDRNDPVETTPDFIPPSDSASEFDASENVTVCEYQPYVGTLSDPYYQCSVDFDNEDAFTAHPDLQPSPVSEFTLYPPVESTPDGQTSVVFEPLPDVNKLKPRVSNSAVLRPKLSTANVSRRQRGYSEDSLDEIIQKDSVQEEIKLHDLLTNSRHQIQRSHLQYIKELGTGWFGKVLQGEGQGILPGHRKTKVVVQMLKEEADSQDQYTFLMESTAFREVDHQNVMKILGQCVESMPYLVVLELCPFGDVKTYLRSHRIAMESFIEKGLLLKFACDMAAGLQAIHQHNFVHHDFAARNCLLASDLSVKIGDYGLNEENFKEDYFVDGNGDSIPIRWMAPESIDLSDGSLNVKKMTKEDNLWSFGVTLWEVIMFGGMPYADLSNEHVMRLVLQEKSVRLPKPDIPITHADRLYQLMQLCWAEPVNRPSLRELRIMLLHLLSQKGIAGSDTSLFDQKWKQLMPRKPVESKRGDPFTSKTVQTVTGSNTLVATQLPMGDPLSSQPFKSNMEELNASKLALAGSIESNSLQETEKNELSLEEELAGFRDGPPNVLSLDQELSNVEENEIENSGDRNVIRNETDVEVTMLDESGEKERKDLFDTSLNIPDIVPTGSRRAGNGLTESPDFVTSTPKKDSQDDTKESDNTEEQYTAQSGLRPDSSEYHTALSGQLSYQSDLSYNEEKSFMDQKKFSNYLQTVATTSFDGDDMDFLNSSTSPDRSLEDPFDTTGELDVTPVVKPGYESIPEEPEKSMQSDEEHIADITQNGDGDMSSGPNLTNASQDPLV